MKLRTQILGALAMAAALPAFAQVKINDTVSVTGWAVASYQYTQVKGQPSTDTTNVDDALLEAIITPAKKTTATVSLFYHPSSEGGVSPTGAEATLLDAYVSYDAGGGVTLSAGKFLSNLGYESFYADADNMITLANQQILAPIPGYHTGFKLDYAPDKTQTMGFQVADSEYNKPGYDATAGDGETRHNGGAEVYYTYTGINNLQIWAGYGYESKTVPGADTDGVTEEIVNGKVIQNAHDVSVGDIWGTYTVDKNGDQVALEEIYKSGGFANTGSDWLAYFLYNLPGTKVSSWFCVSDEQQQNGTGFLGGSYTKYSISPAYTYNANLSVKLQYSYEKAKNLSFPSANFFGTELVFKF